MNKEFKILRVVGTRMMMERDIQKFLKFHTHLGTYHHTTRWFKYDNSPVVIQWEVLLDDYTKFKGMAVDSLWVDDYVDDLKAHELLNIVRK